MKASSLIYIFVFICLTLAAGLVLHPDGLALAPPSHANGSGQIALYRDALRRAIQSHFGTDLEHTQIPELKRAIAEGCFKKTGFRFECRDQSILAMPPGNETAFVLIVRDGMTQLQTIENLPALKTRIHNLLEYPLLRQWDEKDHHERDAIATALGQTLVEEIRAGMDVDLSPLEKIFLSDYDQTVTFAAAKALCAAYTEMVNQGKEISLIHLEKALQDNTVTRRNQAVESLFGPVYLAMIAP